MHDLIIFGKPALEYFFDMHLSETITIFVLFFGLITASIAKLRDWLRKRRLPLALIEKLQDASMFYVKPDLITQNPDHSLEPSKVEGKRKSIIKRLEKSFLPGSTERRFIILAGSGMGKTALLLNIYNRHLKSLLPKYDMVVVELGGKDAIQSIGLIDNHENTILLLDALDENSEAISNVKHALEKISQLTEKFYRVVLTCRTQFFQRDDSLSGLFSFGGGVASAGNLQAGQYINLFLAPLNDHQIRKFLFKKYILKEFSPGKLIKASRLVKKIPQIVVRPMLLSYMDYILDSREKYQYAFQMYDEMVKGWLQRRKSNTLDPEYEEVYKFVRLLAINLVKNYSMRGGYHISEEEIFGLARRMGVNLKDWQISSRSLLNIGANKFYKFAHISIMEFLVARALIGREDIGEWKITDQTAKFMKEMLMAQEPKPGTDLSDFDLQDTDLSHVNLSSVKLKRTNLSRAILEGVDFTNADLSEADLEFQKISKSIFIGTSFENSRMQGLKLSPGSVLKRVNLQGADLTGAELAFVTIEDSNLIRTKFFGANLTGIRIIQSNLNQADLRFIRLYFNDDYDMKFFPLFTDVKIEKAVMPLNWQSFFKGTTTGKPVLDPSEIELHHIKYMVHSWESVSKVRGDQE